MFRSCPFFKIRFTHSIAGNIRRQGRKGNYRRRLRRPTVGVVPALLLFIVSRRARGTKLHISTPLDMFRSRPFFPVCITHSSAKGFLRQGRSMTARTYRLSLTLFNTFNIFPRTGFGPLSPIIRSIGNSGGEPFPVRFFLYSLTRRNARLVETDRDFADRNPPPHSSPKHPEPFAILIGDGPLRGYQRLRTLRRRGTRQARKAVCRPSPRPIGRPRFYFAL